MCPDHSDIRIYADLADLNRGFLALLIAPGVRQAAAGLGLNAAIIDQLRRLSPDQLGFIAGTPGLLACFAKLPAASLLRVAERQTLHPTQQTAWRDSARLYVTGLVTWIWQMDERDGPYCALCAGASETGSGILGEFDFARIRGSAECAVDQLRARFTHHPSFWTDLIRSARSGDEDFRFLSQLTVIPLALAEECTTE